MGRTATCIIDEATGTDSWAEPTTRELEETDF